MAFGQEAKDFMNALGAGIRMQSQMQEAAYTAQAARRLRNENQEWELPENRANRAKMARANADKAGFDAESAGTKAKREAYEFGEYSTPEQAGLRQRERQAIVSNEETTAANNQLTYDKAKHQWFKYLSPRGQALEHEAEEQARQGNMVAAHQKLVDLQKSADEMWALQREHADQLAMFYEAQGKEVPPELELRRNEQAPNYVQDFQERWGVELPSYPDQGEPQTTQAVPTAPRARGQGLTASQNAALNQAADALQVNPADLLAVMSYETGGRLDPNIVGGAGGNYQGLIQFGPNERATYGYRPGMSFEEQVTGPVVAFLKGRGLPPGAGLAEIYSVVNAGSLDENGQPRWNASDGNGTVASHVQTITQQHLPRAQAMVGEPTTQGPGPQQGAVPASPLQAMPRRMYEPATTGSVATPPAEEAPAPSFDANREEMVRAGVKQIVADAGGAPGAVATSDQQAAQRAMIMRDGMKDPEAADAERELFRTWEPDDLTPIQKGLIRDVAMFNWAKRYHPEKAQAYAKEALNSALAEADKFQAFARAAAANGDVEKTLKAAAMSFGYIPNGVDAQVKQQEDGDYEFTFTRGGKTIHREVANPDNILAAVMKMTPADSITALYRYAGMEDVLAKQPSAAFEALTNPGRASGPGMYLGLQPAAERPEGQQEDYPVARTGTMLPPGLKPDEIPKAIDYLKYQQEQTGNSKRSPASADEQNQRLTDIDAAWGQMVGESAGGYGRSSEETPNLRLGDKPLEARNQALIAQQAPWIKSAAQRAIQVNPNLDASAALAGYLDMLKVSPTEPFGRPYQSTVLDNGTVQIDMPGNSFAIPMNDFLYLDDKRYGLERQYFDDNKQAAADKEAAAAAETESGKRGPSVAPAQPGTPPIQTYEGFREAWLAQWGPTAGLGDFDPQALEQAIQRDWQNYQARQARGPWDVR